MSVVYTDIKGMKRVLSMSLMKWGKQLAALSLAGVFIINAQYRLW